MTLQAPHEVVAGTVLEFFESKEVLCGVCLAVKNQRLSVLTEQNREINLARSRVIHFGEILDLKLNRDEMVLKLNEIAALRKRFMQQVDVVELWSLLDGEQRGFAVGELTEYIFSGTISDHQVAAVQRVLFDDRLYFQFKDGLFYPRASDKVEQRRLEIEREEQKEAQLLEGSRWLQAVWNRKTAPADLKHLDAVVENLKSFCLFGQEAPDYAFVKELLKKAGLPPQFQTAFRILLRLGIWQEDENLYLHQQNISSDFTPQLEELALQRAREGITAKWQESGRRDLRDLHAFTIDGALTRDYDDALSIRPLGYGQYEVGIHIADAAEFVYPGDPLDIEAQSRASSIYLPDSRISMLPACLSEGSCSLRAGAERLALSFLLRIDTEGSILAQEIVPSVVKIRNQMTYEEVNENLQSEDYLNLLHQLGNTLRQQRLARGAISLPLPEIQVYVNSAGMIQVSRYEKETPSQIIVSEWMIAANAAAASYLTEHDLPAIYRSQAECRQETDFVHSEHAIFHIYRQRRLFARAELNTRPKMHCSLAMPSYTSITSPIRRYIDLVVQRQLKHAIATGAALYGENELEQMITRLGVVQSKIFLIQRKWTRYWIFKYLEQEDVHTLNALVLGKNHRFAFLLLPDFLMETNMPLPEKIPLQAGEMIRVKLERVKPREDILRVVFQDR